LTAMFGFVAFGIDRHQNARPLMAAIHGDSSEPASICEYRFHRKGSVFYAGHPIALCETPEDLKRYLDSGNRTYIITLAKYQPEIEKNHPGEFEVLCRQRRFLAFDLLVVMKHVEGPRTARARADRDSKQ
jgi:hypothetical protein